jgi:glycosyltransferase involved in cell wall biosynthesis
MVATALAHVSQPAPQLSHDIGEPLRTTVMAALAHGRPVVSGIGFLSEPFWSEWEGLSLVASNEPGSLAAATEALLSNPAARTRLGEAARTLYDSQFALEHTIEILRHAGDLSQEKSPVKSGREEVKS